MRDEAAAARLEAAAVTDRGLNERRPHNEDSMLNDAEHRIFAVADGVGGAEAGEVASKTAIDILAEAFVEHRVGDDAEDLMEIAIQRANDSIFHLSRDDARYRSMATTIVALHIDGSRATVGHVGDSRLYRYTPEGKLFRETDDHSVVEEEVRAGRMTPEQAAHHPSRNIISRAIGAEAAVEVDTKTFDFDPGTTFLLCSDGITRHIPDDELAAILRGAPSLEMACEVMKERCFERGAEDNLTAVLVRAGGAGRRPASAPHSAGDDEEVTLIQERPKGVEPAHGGGTGSLLQRPFHNVGVQAATATAAQAAAPAAEPEREAAEANPAPAERDAPARSGGALRTLGSLLVLAAAVLVAFYAGMLFARRSQGESPARAALPTAATTPAATPAASVAETDGERFERRRKAVDLSPPAEASRMATETNNQPLASEDPEFLYLYGRALLLSDRQPEAAEAFERAVQKAGERQTPRHAELKIDARLAQVAAHLRAGDSESARRAADSLAEFIRAPGVGANTVAAPAVTPFR